MGRSLLPGLPYSEVEQKTRDSRHSGDCGILRISGFRESWRSRDPGVHPPIALTNPTPRTMTRGTGPNPALARCAARYGQIFGEV